jgi:hypothetical protein
MGGSRQLLRFQPQGVTRELRRANSPPRANGIGTGRPGSRGGNAPRGGV